MQRANCDRSDAKRGGFGDGGRDGLRSAQVSKSAVTFAHGECRVRTMAAGRMREWNSGLWRRHGWRSPLKKAMSQSCNRLAKTWCRSSRVPHRCRGTDRRRVLSGDREPRGVADRRNARSLLRRDWAHRRRSTRPTPQPARRLRRTETVRRRHSRRPSGKETDRPAARSSGQGSSGVETWRPV